MTPQEYVASAGLEVRQEREACQKVVDDWIKALQRNAESTYSYQAALLREVAAAAIALSRSIGKRGAKRCCIHDLRVCPVCPEPT